jgi:hypothetical protein
LIPLRGRVYVLPESPKTGESGKISSSQHAISS